MKNKLKKSKWRLTFVLIFTISGGLMVRFLLLERMIEFAVLIFIYILFYSVFTGACENKRRYKNGSRC